MLRILAFDPAAHFGWSLVTEDEYLAGGTKEFKFPTKVQQEKKGIGKGKKWQDAYEWLDAKVSETRPDFVIAEDVRRHTSTLAGHSYGFLRYAIEAVCYKHGVPFYPIGVSTWKTIAATDGGAEKSDVDKAMTVIYPGIVWETDDHSDSAGMAYAAKVLHSENRLGELLASAGGKKKKETKPKKEKKPKKS